MRSFMKVLCALTAGMLLVAFPLMGQVRGGMEYSIGGGLGVPSGDFNEAFDIGWHGQLAGTYTLTNIPLAFQIDASLAQFSAGTALDLKQRMFYGTGDILYKFRIRETVLEPYVIAGGGVYYMDPVGTASTGLGSRTKGGINGGVGLNFRPSNVNVFFESRFHHVFHGLSANSDLQFNDFTAGFRLVP